MGDIDQYQTTTKHNKARIMCITLRWRHNDHDGVSNHQPRGCLLNRWFTRRSKKTSKLRVTGLCAGNSPGPVNSPHKGPVTRKMLPFDDVIMILGIYHMFHRSWATLLIMLMCVDQTVVCVCHCQPHLWSFTILLYHEAWHITIWRILCKPRTCINV